MIGASPAAYFDGNTYFLYYQGRDGTYEQTGLATSTDGINWVKHPSNPVLPHGSVGSWDEEAASAGGLFVYEGTFYLFYTGRPLDGSSLSIGLAASDDGASWTKHAGNPVLAGGVPGTWDWFVGDPCPVVRDTIVQLWYAGNVHYANEWSIGYATSPFTPTSVPDAGEDLPRGFSLRQNYPNPFNPTTTFRYALSEDAPVTLKIYNILGQLVKTVVNDYQSAGYYESLWDGRNDVGSHAASGVYIYRMVAGNFTATKRMLFLK